MSKKRISLSCSRAAGQDKLYTAIRSNDAEEIKRLKAEGVKLSAHVRVMLRNGGRNPASLFREGAEKDWKEFNYRLRSYSPEEFVSVVRNLRAELNGPMFCLDSIRFQISGFYSPEVFRCVLDCFDTGRINKKQTLISIIDNNMTKLLQIASEHGWLRFAGRCDEYIEYAQENDRVECVAWLLNYKNKAFDPNAERDKSERRRNAELNAAPDSVMMMKTLWRYQKLEDGNSIKIRSYKGDRTEIIIPEKIGNNTVTALEVVRTEHRVIREFVPEEIREAVTKITLPKGLVSIGSYVFSDLTELCEINIPDGVVSIGEQAFPYCKNLKALKLPDSLREIGSAAFYNCNSLEEINIPQGIKTISSQLFTGCEKLRAVSIPDSVRSIEQLAFGGTGIESVMIPNSVTEIGSLAFEGCEKLTRVELPNTLVKIGNFAFRGCLSLKELVIPEGVREIGKMALSNCATLERVTLPASLSKIMNDTSILFKAFMPQTLFEDSPNVTAIVTPESYAEDYCRENDIPYEYRK